MKYIILRFSNGGNMKKILLISFLIFFSIKVLAANKVKTYAIGKIPGKVKACLTEVKYNKIYIYPYFHYFAEDHSYNYTKDLRFQEKPNFRLFLFKKRRLYKHFFVIQNKEKIKEGFYNKIFKILKTKKL